VAIAAGEMNETKDKLADRNHRGCWIALADDGELPLISDHVVSSQASDEVLCRSRACQHAIVSCDTKHGACRHGIDKARSPRMDIHAGTRNAQDDRALVLVRAAAAYHAHHARRRLHMTWRILSHSTLENMVRLMNESANSNLSVLQRTQRCANGTGTDSKMDPLHHHGRLQFQVSLRRS
jgi:hypothetical protein